jgi:hypothetical protein
MKYFPGIALFVFALCYPPTAVQASPTDEVSQFLTGCKITADDVKAAPKLPAEGQKKLQTLAAAKDCSALKNFQATREYLRKFKPPPEQSPMPPKGFDNDFLTQDESDYVNQVNKSILDKLFEWFGGGKR